MTDEQTNRFMEKIRTLSDVELKSMLHPDSADPAEYLLIVGELLLRRLKKDDERAKHILKSD